MKGFDPAMLGEEMMKRTPSRVDDALASKGRGNDSLIAHLSPREAAILKSLGGAGTINPKTGLLEFWDSDGEDGNDGSSSPGGGATAGEVGSGLSESDSSINGGFDPSGGSGLTGINEAMGIDPSIESVGEENGSGLEDSIDPARPGGITGALNAANSVAEEDTPGAFQGIMDSITPASALSAVNKAYDDFMEAHPSVKSAMTTAKDAFTGFSLTGSPFGAVAGALFGGIARGASSMSEMSDEDRAAAIASINESSRSPISSGNGIDISEAVGETADLAEPAATPVSTGRIVTRPAYRFNRQMVGLSAKNIYPERV